MTHRQIFERAAIGLASVGIDGRLLDANPHLCELLGYARQDLLGQTLDGFDPAPENRRPGLKRLLAGKCPALATERQLRRRDGRLLWVRQTWSLAMPADSNDNFLVVTVEDIHRRRQRITYLQNRCTRALERDLAKSRLLAAVSHDLRQPLQSMALFAETLGGGTNDELQRAALTRLNGCLSDIRNLVDSLIDLARLNAGKVRPILEEVDLFALMDLLAACYAPLAAAKGLAWGMLPVCRILRVRTDPTLLTRILRNLLENAIRYTDAGGIHLRCVAAGDGLVDLQVIDSGPGIPADQLHHIFDEFHQLRTNTAEGQPGMGLGLTIVRRLSSILGHPVRVASELGRGSLFSIAVELEHDVISV